MSYTRLPFNQYYIDESNGYRNKNKRRFNIEFNHTEFEYKFLWKKVKCSADWEIHYEADRNVIQINFEETNGNSDWFINFMFKEKMYDSFHILWKGKKRKITLRAAAGWAKMYKSLKHDLKIKFRELWEQHPNAEVEICGWSLGSGQAQFCAQDLNWNFGIEPHVFTHGSVNPWRGFACRDYIRSLNKEAYNFKHRSDIVGYLPPFIGYFCINPVWVGKFSFKELFNPARWHTEYGEEYLYEKC